MSLSDLFISDAFAVASNQAQQSGGFMNFVPLILIFIIFYFLLIRPQQKKAKQHQEMVSSLKIGNRVCTNSGIFGIIKKINKEDNTVDLEIADNVVIKVLKFSVSEVTIKVVEKNSKVKKTTSKKSAKTKK